MSNTASHPGGKRRSPRFANPIERLERRLLLAALDAVDHPPALLSIVESNDVPRSKFLFRHNGTLTKSSPAAPLEIALSYLRANARVFGISASDIGDPLVTDQYTDADSGTTHIYLRQQLNGLRVVNADINVTVLRSGRILSVGGAFVAGLAARAGEAIAPRLSASEALASVGTALGLRLTRPPVVLATARGVDRSTLLRAPEASLEEISARLQYVGTPGGAELAWQLILQTPDGKHWYDTSVSAESGAMLFTADWTDSFAGRSASRSGGAGSLTAPATASDGPETANYSASFNVFPRPYTSPNSGARQNVGSPWDLAASPFGWQDLNGTPGGDSSVTNGNNVSAQDDTDGNNSGGTRPSGGSLNPDGTGSLSFNFPIDFAQPPATYLSAATTNLYYWNNILHDIHFKYGFTEAAGNFQVMNYSGQGLGADAVQADSQDGSGTNNANFSTPPDGSSPRMQMFVWNYFTPNRDSDVDNGVIIHEYGHGVSNRLTGGPGNSGALSTLQSGGMGEGWSDWWALMFAQTDGSIAAQMGSYPIGAYVVGQPLAGAGIRRYPYSFDKSVNPQTFGEFNSSTEVHHSGEYWCSALWDLNWLLIRKHGFNPDVTAGYTPGAAGNLLALRLVMDALKIQPASPSFVQARDAILAADTALTGGANHKQIWMAFARRGLGAGTVNGNSDETTITQAFDVPAGVMNPAVTHSAPYETLRFSALSLLTFQFNNAMNPGTFSVAADVGSFVGPGGVNLLSQITGSSWSNGNKTLTINFNAQTTDGTYTLTIGPNITAAGSAAQMDQDLDGIAGELTDDQYSASVLVTPRPGPEAAGYEAALHPLENIDLVPGAAGVVSLLGSDDDASASIPLGANTFRFYGTTYTGSSQLHISDNALITFGAGSTLYRNNNMTRDPAQPGIAVLWDDWATDHDANDQVLYFFDTPNNRLIIEWNQVVNRGDFSAIFGTTNATFQAILTLNTGANNGDVILNYPDLSVGNAGSAYANGGSATVGIKTAGQPGANRLLLSLFNWPQTWLGDGKAVRITTTSVSGASYIDANGNGAQDAGETALAGQIVYIDANNNSTLDSGENFTTTDAAGSYTLTSVPVGSVRIRQVTSGGYVQTSANAGLVNVTSGQQLGNVKFGNFPIAFAGATRYTLRLDPTQTRTQIWVDTPTSNPPTFSADKTIIPSLSFTGSPSDNTLTIDMSNSDPLPAAGVIFDGLGQITDDVLEFDGGSAGDTISVSGTAVSTLIAAVSYSNLEGISVRGNGGDDILSYTAPVAPSVSFFGGGNDDTLTINALPGNSPTLNLGAGNDTLIVNGTGFILGTDGNAGGSNLTVNVNGSMSFAATQHLAALNIAAGASATLAVGGSRVLVTSILSIAGTGRLDLTNNDMIVDYTGASPLSAVQSLLTTGYASAGWNGNGISSSTAAGTSTTALGFAEAIDLFTSFPAIFSGQSIDNTAVLVKYTFYGDADLSGNVNLTDFNRLAANFGQTARRWVHGDFNFDATVNLLDFNRLAANFGSSGLTPMNRPSQKDDKEDVSALVV